MNREILFRGVALDTDKWIIGYGVIIMPETKTSFIIHKQGNNIHHHTEVISETVGQFTGLMDKNGNKIFEGETCKILYSDWVSKLDSDPRTLDQYLDDISHEGEIVWDDESNGWGIRIYSKKYDEYSIWGINYGKHGHIKITSNIHDNPTT